MSVRDIRDQILFLKLLWTKIQLQCNRLIWRTRPVFLLDTFYEALQNLFAFSLQDNENVCSNLYNDTIGNREESQRQIKMINSIQMAAVKTNSCIK